MMRAGSKQWTAQQEQTAADDGKQQDPTTAGNKRRGKGGRRRRMQIVNAYSYKFKALWCAAVVIIVVTRIPIVFCVCVWE
jgi:hypothetical protein